MTKRSPTKPAQAHHRLLKSLVKTGHGKEGLDPRPEEFDRVSRVFQLAGGSWQRVFRGSATDMNLLKKTVKVAVEKGVFTKSPEW